MPEDLVALESQYGRSLMHDCHADAAFWRLAQFYAPQPDLGSCGLASCITVLNALPLERPLSAHHGEFRFFTAESFFTPKVDAIVTRKESFGIWHDA